MTTILIVGISGKSGTAVARAALAAGYGVRGTVRDRNKAAHLPQEVALFLGDGRDARVLEPALQGVDAVVVTAGSRNEPVTSAIVKTLLPLMEKVGIGRLVVLTAYGAIDGKGFYGWMMRTMAGQVCTDKQETEILLRNSALEWTAVQPGILTDGPATGRVVAEPGAVLKGMPQISRSDVAAFIVGELGARRYLHSSPVLSVRPA